MRLVSYQRLKNMCALYAMPVIPTGGTAKWRDPNLKQAPGLDLV